MVNQKIIAEELIKLHLYYHMAKRSIEEIEVLAEMWLEDFKGISAEVFREACGLHRKASQHMPTGKDVLDRCSDVWEAQIRNTAKIEENIPKMTPEEIKAAADRVRQVMRDVGLPPKRRGKMPSMIKNPGVRTPELVERVQQRLNKFKGLDSEPETDEGTYGERND